MLVTWYVDVAFPYLFCQKSRENRMFLQFFRQKSIFAYSLLECVYYLSDCEYFQTFEDALTL